MTTKIPSRMITSGTSTDGQVLTSDGAGVAAFETPLQHVKAWGYFTGESGTTAKVAGYNFASVSRSSTGNYVVTLTSALANTNYAIVALGGGNNLNTTVTCGNIPTKTTTTFSLLSYNANAGTAVDCDYVYFVVLGE